MMLALLLVRQLIRSSQALSILASKSQHRVWRLVSEQRRLLQFEAAAWTGQATEPNSPIVQRLAQLTKQLSSEFAESRMHTRALIAMFIAGGATVAIVDLGAMALTLHIRRQIKDSMRELMPRRASTMVEMTSTAAPPATSGLRPVGEPAGVTSAVSGRQSASGHQQSRLRELQRVEKMQMMVSPRKQHRRNLIIQRCCGLQFSFSTFLISTVLIVPYAFAIIRFNTVLSRWPE